jgi:alkylation response protein AidB-like acyl-CoA dehydrogenase
MFRQMFAQFAEKEIEPLAEEIDKKEEIPAALLQKAAEQGFFGALVPEEPYYGAGLDTISYLLMIEEIAKHCASTALTVHVHNSLATRPILQFGTDEQKEKYLPDMIMGEKIGAFALTEPDAGSDAASLRTVAVEDGDFYLLNGTKTWVSNGGIAGVYIVFAKTDPEAGAKGITAFIVDRDTPGLKVGGRELTLGLRGASITTIYLDDARVPKENLLGGLGNGFKIALSTLDFARMAVSAAGLGIAEHAFAEGSRYASERKQFGVEIATKQVIQKYIADSWIKIDGLRHSLYHTAWLADQGERYTAEAAALKVMASEVAFEVADTMVQVHGGYGFIKEYPVERIYRDARALSIVEGTNEILKVIIAGKVFAEYGLKIKP